MAHYYTKGLASEHVITKLANLAAQVSINDKELMVQGHPDIFISSSSSTTTHDDDDGNNDMKENNSSSNTNVKFSNGEPVIIELKDTSSGERMDFKNSTFKSYLNQLLYYLV
jgi:hypothetical protein